MPPEQSTWHDFTCMRFALMFALSICILVFIYCLAELIFSAFLLCADRALYNNDEKQNAQHNFFFALIVRSDLWIYDVHYHRKDSFSFHKKNAPQRLLLFCMRTE